jgi:hypothetical protein
MTENVPLIKVRYQTLGPGMEIQKTPTRINAKKRKKKKPEVKQDKKPYTIYC